MHSVESSPAAQPGGSSIQLKYACPAVKQTSGPKAIASSLELYAPGPTNFGSRIE